MTSIKAKKPGKERWLSSSTYKTPPHARLGESKGSKSQICWGPWESFPFCSAACCLRLRLPLLAPREDMQKRWRRGHETQKDFKHLQTAPAVNTWEQNTDPWSAGRNTPNAQDKKKDSPNESLTWKQPQCSKKTREVQNLGLLNFFAAFTGWLFSAQSSPYWKQSWIQIFFCLFVLKKIIVSCSLD